MKIVDTAGAERRISGLPAAMPRAGTSQPPLAGVRVLDLTHFIAGPLATLILADGGAEVIKVEPPGRGDDFRHYPPADPRAPGDGVPFMWVNRNKKSVVLDLKSGAGLAVARELVKNSDVLVENFSSGVLDRLGLGYEACRALNPRLVYATCSAYGSDGPFADRGGFDAIAQAESGFTSMNGYPDRDGVKTGATVIDMSTASMLSNAILLALMSRHSTGEGQRVEVCLFDTGLFMTGFAPMQYYFTGVQPPRSGNTPPDTSPSGVFHCRDRAFMLNSGNARIFERLIREVLGCDELVQDPAWSDVGYRITNRARLTEILEREFSKYAWAQLQPRLRQSRVPHGEVRTLPEALASEEATQRQRVNRIPHDRLGWVPNFPLPFTLSSTPLADPNPAPGLGQHTREILSQFFDETHLGTLESGGAFGPGGLIG
jgi:crotonobetainyl-CoA:carnitine CoA-transferase CaiB-like acyl-CoA transferase